MEKKEYLVGVTVIEARKLRAKDQSTATSDPFVKITCGNSAPQVTQKRFSTNAVVWNQSFTFPGVMMNQYELETFELIFEVFDYNAMLKNDLIGQFSVGLSTMYKSLNHEFYRQWLTLNNPELPNGSDIQGYLQVSCFIVGPNDRPPGHSNDDKIEDEEQISEEMFQGMSEQQKIEIMKKKQGLFLLNEPDIFRKGYQLSVSILKAEGLPQITDSSADSFISVRASGYVQITRIIPKNLNPQFNARLCFPVYTPIYNDKIIIRLWHHNPPSLTGKAPDIFIGNVPEFPSSFDPFNISKLLINEGKMRATWFNIYGSHPNERKNIVKGEKKEGSQFLGRILIAMILVPHEKPQMYPTIANPMKEPTSENYKLWVDVYDLVNCDDAKGQPLWLYASMGSFQTTRFPAQYRKKTETYWWPSISLEQLKVNFPIDIRQTPDIFIYIGIKEKDIKGYIRIPAKDCQRNQPSPQWYRLRSLKSDKYCPGIILMNIQYVWDNNSDRFPKQRAVEAPYKFFAQIISGFEIAPSIPEKDLTVKVEFKIGNLSVAKKDNNKKSCTAVINGSRHPIWEEKIFEQDIMMDKNIQFASDMRVMVTRSSTGMFDSNLSIGDFFVPIKSISKQLYAKPQYFNIISNEGKLEGQILARFFVQQLNNKNTMLEEFQKIRNELYTMGAQCFTVDIKIAVFGIRNLIKDAKNATITFKLSTQRDQTKVIKQKEGSSPKNPNFGEICEFNKVKLSFEPLLWPLLLIEVTDSRNFLGSGGCEDCYTTIPLFDFAPNILSEKQRTFTRAQFNKNQNSLKLVQKQINPTKFYQKYLKKSSRPADEDEGGQSQSDDSDNSDDDKKQFGYQMAGGMRVKELENDYEVFQYDDLNYSDDEKPLGRKVNKGNKGLIVKEQAVDASDIQLKFKNKKGRVHMNDGLSSDEESKQPKDKQTVPVGETIGQLGNIEGAVIGIEDMIMVECTPQIKKAEKQIRNEKIQRIEERIEEHTLKIQQTKNKEEVQKLKRELFDMKNKIQYLQDEEMIDEKFWGYAIGEEGGQEEFQYGRDVIKEGTFESTQLKMPYYEFPLLSPYSSHQRATAQVGGMLRSGFITGATLKAFIKVVESDPYIEEEDSEDKAESITPGNPGDEVTPGGPEQGEEIEQELNEENALSKIQRNFPYDITETMFLTNLLKQQLSFKVRVYVLSCQNLSATGSEIDVKARLAGLEALCSANAYPIIKIGDGQNNPGQQKIKMMSFRDKEVKQDLNPKFYLSYELDATFPEDWRLEVIINDKGRFELLGRNTDSLIGSTVIDLENRLQGNFRRQTIDALQIYKDHINEILRKESRKEKQDKKLKKEKEMLKDKITKHQQNLMNKIPEKLVPIEFRELRHPSKNQAQGIVEMWVEVLTKEEARKTPMARLQQERKDEYEIRLIIWETRDVPIINGSSVDIFVKVQFDPTGWSGGQIEKCTDTHYGSIDGRCIFNYRFKFDISTPCEFPRLKFQMFDFGVMSDEAIGESLLNLKKTMGLLAKEERIDIPKTWLSFNSPNDRLDDVGQLLISMQILNKADADLSPVGEAQDEPNDNPKLEKPTEGRGMGNRILAVTGIDVSNISLPQVNFFRNFIIIGIVFGVVILMLIIIMFLK